ncbi:P-loop containing nucleoside triphosphate hydrolase protein [Dendrothele bispora CBS 962.96]|uniref:P-loop containing nucleoside triphosphate hydrolase protein n=1 Tax=Dendrothele bispora (strain CBS 962.96) TaxID=1314807 RepID=A0A4S8LHG5_DENBC|nr:P-loop containing nucleoside triphosphate hydrolase protein [Dendrothele bispora CBS 962.96]
MRTQLGYVQFTVPQIVLDGSDLAQSLTKESTTVFANTLLIPLYVVAASVLFLLLHIVLVSRMVRKWLGRASHEEPVQTPPMPVGLAAEVKEHVEEHGGPVIYAYMLARLLGSLALLGLSITSLVIDEIKKLDVQSEDEVSIAGKKGRRRRYGTQFSKREWLEAAMCLTFLYTSLLALISVTAKPRWSRIIIRHLNTVLFATFCVYVYRDVYPLITYALIPVDKHEGSLLWAKIAVLTFTAVFVPLLIPRQYVPVDPNHPLEVPNPEQTACLLSMATYQFLDPLVWTAYKVTHLAFDQLPPLNDNDQAHVLKERSFRYLDIHAGAPRRHIFFGLMRIFRREYVILALSIILHVAANFAGPIGINRLLRYLEPDGKEVVVRPWFWIIWLFIGPVGGTLSIQWYVYIATRTLVRAQAIITQLVFEHSLRIRVKAEVPESSKTANSSPSTPDAASLVDGPSASSLNEDGTTVHSASSTEEETLGANSASVVSKDTQGKGKKEEKNKEPTSDSSNLVGKINNLVTTDLENIIEGRDFLFAFVYIPVQITLCIIFLYIVVGWSAFVGLAIILIMFPVPGFIAKLVQDVQSNRLKKTDARVQTVTETMNVLRMVKLFGWEQKMEGRIAEKREEELVWIWRRQILELLNGTIKSYSSLRVMLTMYHSFTLIMKETLTASVVFSSMTVFDMLRDQLHIIFNTITLVMTGKVSLDRVSSFLRETELLDSFSEKTPDSEYFIPADESQEQEIGFRNASFTWSSDVDGTLTPSKRKFLLKIEDELIFQKGCINLIIGETGSGKTSLLMALLSEMHFIPSSPDSWYNLPRGGGVAYAAQESWVLNETIKENILFGAPLDEGRYKKVIYQCGLERDITLFEAGDATEVGEKGLTLSGGQKARITLARAIYSNAEIILLDDVLAALDVHTSKWIIEKCFCGDLVKGRTIILVTHNVALARPIASFVIAMKDGHIESQGTVADALKKDTVLSEEAKKDQEVINRTDEEIDHHPPPDEPKGDGKLIAAEEIEEGHVSWSAVKMYFSGMGGNYPWVFFVSVVSASLITELLNAGQTYFLGYWTSQYDGRDPSDVPVIRYLGIYVSFLACAVVTYACGYMIFLYGGIRASRTIHGTLVQSVLGTTLRWLDTTPTSRVIARCTQDIRAVDGPVPMWLQWVGEISMMMIVKFFAVVAITPVFFFPGVLVAVLGGACGQIYIKAQLSVKREMSNAKSPVLGHFGAAIAGLTSIRAYGSQTAFVKESLRRIDRYSRAARTFYNLNRWVCIRIDALGGMFSAGLAFYLVYYRDQTAANTGFSLNMAIGFSSLILWWVRNLNEFEVQGNSLERIQGYVKIEQEPKPTSEGKPPAYWPSSGELRVENLSARYSLDGPKVLKDISFNIKSGERIGVVGRTGSGKSSLTLSLLRCIFTEGHMYFDGLETSKMNLDALRSSITIIPQVPELLSGTLRQNLDPFDQYDDAMLNSALRAAGLFSLQNEMNESGLSLDSAISSGGSNLSVGQRQILALARAIVRGSKLLILDEATSAIDYKTDSIIQSSLRNELKGDVTLITVAHRLQTIMDADKIMVLDAGKIVEFDSPKALLQIESGRLRALVDESNDKEILYQMANGKT